MKVVYIGSNDELSLQIVKRISKEGHEIYYLSDKSVKERKDKTHIFKIPDDKQIFEKLIASCNPDCIIFAGYNYMDYYNNDSLEKNMDLLTKTLRVAKRKPDIKFVLLSSTEVYELSNEKRKETNLVSISERGMTFAEEEQLVEMYHNKYHSDIVILRAGSLYSNTVKESDGTFLAHCFSITKENEQNFHNEIVYPIHIMDFVDAINKSINYTINDRYIYDVCGDETISTEEVCHLIGNNDIMIATSIASPLDCITNCNIKQDMKWENFYSLRNCFKEKKITYEEEKKKKNGVLPIGIRKTLENIIIFATFFLINLFCIQYQVLSNFDVLLIYIIIISIFYNIYQSGLAVILASVSYIMMQDISSMDINIFSTYAIHIVEIVKYIFLGLIISYNMGIMRGENKGLTLELGALKDEYNDLKNINDENILIKNEYEQMLLTSKVGLPKMYNLVSKLITQEPNKILIEIVDIIAELIHTDTIAIYKWNGISNYLRLVVSLNQKSVIDGKTVDLNNHKAIYESIKKGKLYRGKMGGNEPAVVMPIIIDEKPQVVVFIKELPYEYNSIYYINLLKTLSLLLQNSMKKAIDYEEEHRQEHYLENTSILKPKAFLSKINVAKEKAKKSLGDYCVVKIEYNGSFLDISNKISQALRITDYLGTDGNNGFYILLDEITSEDIEKLANRLPENVILKEEFKITT